MNTKTTWITVIIVVAVIVIAWFSLDRRNTESIPGDSSLFASSTAAASQIAPVAMTVNGQPVSSASPAPSATTNQPVKNLMHTITIKTDKGTIVFETYDADAPKAAQNFITLAQKGFYNGTIFHRIIPGFMIQGGDPTGTGMGGPGYSFADELNPATASYKAGYVRGTVAMANSGPNTNGSQFFIMQADNPLPHSYTIFGKVISGMDVVDAIANVPVDSSTHNMPTTPIKMTSVTVADMK